MNFDQLIIFILFVSLFTCVLFMYLCAYHPTGRMCLSGIQIYTDLES